MDGTSLADVLNPWTPDRIDRLRCGEVVAVFAPLADALAVVHAAGGAHRAITARRIRLGPDGAVSIGPPTRVRAGRRAQANDISDLAALIVDALLGAPDPDEESSPFGIPADWAERAYALGVPPGLVTVLAGALAPVPERRPTAGEVATALRETCDPLPLDRLWAPAAGARDGGGVDQASE